MTSTLYRRLCAQEFQRWHATSPNVYFVIVGPELDPAVVEEMRAITSAGTRQSSGVTWFAVAVQHMYVLLRADPTGAVRVLGPVPRPVLLGWMRQSDVVLNTSESEGMCGRSVATVCAITPLHP
jgi:hypothetical protein